MFEGIRIKKILVRLEDAKTEDEQNKAIDDLISFGSAAFIRVVDIFRSRRINYERFHYITQRICDESCLYEVLPLIGDRQSDVRMVAKELILKRWKEQSVPFLIEYLKSPDMTMRANATELLGVIKSQQAVPKLITIFNECDSEIKRSIIKILSETGGPASSKVIMGALNDSVLSVRVAAVKALGAMKDHDAVKLLTEKLSEEDAQIRRATLEALGSIGDKRAALPMLLMLRDTDMIIRQKAVEYILQVADSEVIPDVIALMRDRDVNVRRCAVDVLNGLKDPRTSEVLLKAMKDSDWWVRQIATDALSELKGENIVRFFITMLKDSTDESMRRLAAEFFSKVPDESALEPLIHALDDTDWWVREKAVTALGVLKNKRAVEPLSKLMEDEEIKGVIPDALFKIGGAEVIPPLLALMNDRQKRVRIEALKALGKLKNPDSVPQIKELLNDDDDDIKIEAVDTLKKITGKLFRIGEGKSQETGAIGTKTVVGHLLPEGSIQTEAILVVDLCDSTGIANRYGDQFALNLTKTLTETAKPISRREQAQFSKSTGDGFLITFPKIRNAVNFALDLLREIAKYNEATEDTAHIDLRFAINFGETRTDAKGDRLGVATNMTFRVEGVKPADLKPLEGGMKPEDMPLVNRIFVTEHVVGEAAKMQGIKVQPVGFFELKGIAGLHKVFELKCTG
ncbi:MAG: HEAT repeat domain-containing protein [Nitrospirae bacterium]|nr:HEAT repeat domain-containing protein [Nitrospirota bacterium]